MAILRDLQKLPQGQTSSLQMPFSGGSCASGSCNRG